MKKYKANYMVTIMFRICNMILITFPGAFLMWLILNPNEKEGVLYIFPTYGVILFFCIIFGNIIHFIVSLFTKHKVFIDKTKVELKGKKLLTKAINIEEVKYILIDQGTITKYGGGSAFSVTLFNIDYTKLLQIDNPSFFMILCLIKNCKNAKVKFNNYKWYIIFCILFTIFSVILCFVSAN